jgi:hypothetical protein
MSAGEEHKSEPVITNGTSAVKNPRHRESFRHFQEQVWKRVLDRPGLVSTEDITEYIAEIENPDFIDFCLREAAVDRDWIDTAKSEISTGLEILFSRELIGRRILEVGALLSVLSDLLRGRGYDLKPMPASAPRSGSVSCR